MAGIKQRRDYADFIDVTPSTTATYAQMGSGFETLDNAPNAQTSTKRYINQAGSTTSLTGYEWTAPFTADQIRDQEAIDFICNIGEMELTGVLAETSYVKADLTKPVTVGGTAFEAKERRVVVAVADLNDNDGELQLSGDFLAISDWVIGKFDISTGTFTPEV